MYLMDLARTALQVVGTSRLLYVQLDPAVLDHTIDEPGTILIHGESGTARIPLRRATAVGAFSLLEHAIDDRTVIAHGFKDLATLARVYTNAAVAWSDRVRDVQVIERYLGIDGKPPGSLPEAMGRLRAVDRADWRRVYKAVLLPLMSEAVPAMESRGLVHRTRRCLVYPHYLIEDQRHGRMKARDVFAPRGYNPHTMGADPDLRPLDGERFLGFDYRNMEVAVLAWLSGDRRLQLILESGLDVYATIWQFLTDEPPTRETRQQCKEVFLPVAYGMGEALLGERLGDPGRARILMGRIHERFPAAMGYLRAGQDSMAPNGLVLDHFGRPRVFENRSHKIRNFLIQAPAAVVCEERLVALHRATAGVASLAFHVHDGYVLTCKHADSERAFALAKESLEAESPLCPGLRLLVSGKVGDRLDRLS